VQADGIYQNTRSQLAMRKSSEKAERKDRSKTIKGERLVTA